jgi:hypothetical protein
MTMAQYPSSKANCSLDSDVKLVHKITRTGKHEHNDMTTTPTIHLNGTAKGDLLEPLCEAMHAIRKARIALAATAPNGRDYYPQGPDAITDALAEHWARLKKLNEVLKELEVLAEAVS